MRLRHIISRLLGRPEEHASDDVLTPALKAFTGGDTRVRVEVPESPAAAEVAQAFNAMAEKIGASLDELTDTRDYLEGIIESSADIIVTANPKGYVYSFNRGAEEALGYGRGEVIGRPIEKLFADPHERDRAQRRLKGVDNVANFETRLLTKGGETRDVMLTLSRLRAPNGRTIGTFGIGKDVTDAKGMQKRLLHAERFAAIGQAFAGIQHSMKNMLNALKGGAYMVRIGLSKDDRKLLEEGWCMVQDGIQRLTAMSSQMLSYVREWKPRFEAVDLGAMAKEVEETHRATAEEAGLAFRAEAPEEPAVVVCDAKLVFQVLMDLVSNSIDACRERDYADGETAEIVVAAHAEARGSLFTLSVRDNGCGMPPDVKANIFTPFFSTKRSSGTGLGLALTARTIRLHGGEIEVESQVNVGTEFRIILPTDGPQADKEGADAQEGAGHR